MSPSRDEITGDAEARNDFWSIQGDYIYRLHVKPRVQLCVLKEQGTFSIPLEHIDMTTTTHTTLDVLQESGVDNYWNIDVNRNLSKSLTGFTKFKIQNGKTPRGYMWSSGRLVKKFKQLPDLTICGQTCVPTCHKQLYERKSINGYR